MGSLFTKLALTGITQLTPMTGLPGELISTKPVLEANRQEVVSEASISPSADALRTAVLGVAEAKADSSNLPCASTDHPAYCPIGVAALAAEFQLLQQQQGLGEGGMVSSNSHTVKAGLQGIENYGKAVLSGDQIPLVHKAFENLENKIEYELDEYVSRLYNVPTWAPMLIRFMYDLHLDEAYETEDPMAAVFGSAAIPLQNFWNYLTLLDFDSWYKIRMEAYTDEFIDFKTYTMQEARMMAHCYQSLNAESLQAAQFISRDVACQTAWKAVANHTEEHELKENPEFNAYWAGSISDVARRAAMEIVALANGYADIDQSCLRLLKVTFEELNINYHQDIPADKQCFDAKQFFDVMAAGSHLVHLTQSADARDMRGLTFLDGFGIGKNTQESTSQAPRH
ncbi:MAG: hypothetical protein SFZ03_08195 [Candidatus Melainabacteria bacterium]|nr:hypothetical protein [Candidatus Melainabacteria bacterium]